MSLESEIKNLTGAMTRLAEGVEKLLTLGHAAPSEKQQWLDSAPGTAAPQSVVNPPPPVVEFEAPTADPSAREALARSQPGAENAAKPLTLEDIKKALMATAAKFDAVTGTAKSKAILSRFGAVKLSQVPMEAYAEFIALCESVAAGGEP